MQRVRLLVVTGPTMRVKAIAGWFGSKRTMTRDINIELGRHSMFVDCFCGSLAALFGKDPCSVEMVNDLHGDLVNLARVVGSDRAPELYGMASRVLCTEVIHAECWARLASVPCEPAPSMREVSDEHLRRALDFLAVSWMSRGESGGCSWSDMTYARRYSDGGGGGATRWRSAVESVPAWHKRLQGVQVLQMDAVELIGRLKDERGLAIYADPPYIEQGGRYVHSMTPEQHRDLARGLNRFKAARVVVSYYAHPMLAELYPGWTVVDRAKAKSAGNTDGKKRASPEVLLINGPSYGNEMFRSGTCG